ncbi:hypothetical protein, partial [Methanosarcina mazei]
DVYKRQLLTLNTPNVEHSYLRDFRVVLFTPSGKIYNFLSFFSLRSTWTEPVFQLKKHVISQYRG